MTENSADALSFVKEKHAGQVHAHNVPVWHHLKRVSERLEQYLEMFNEGAPEERRIIVRAALGHDLLEDTDATPKEIERIFGSRGAGLIGELTNEWGDEDVRPYVRKVAQSSQEARLIKLSDLTDNITSVTYNIKTLGIPWTTSYFLPVVTPMAESVRTTSFPLYPKTSAHFIALLDVGLVILKRELERMVSQ